MMPGMNPRAMKQAMKRMGMQQEDIEATRVIIETAEARIIFDAPAVAKVNVMGQSSWQISGEERIEALDTTPDISAEDVETVMAQANVSEDVAMKAIQDANGDLAEAIMNLQAE